MNSCEFKIYIVWAAGSIAMFPALQWSYRDNLLLREVIPELAYSLQVLVVATLGTLSHIRFRRLMYILPNQNHTKTLITKLSYFRDMNQILTISLYSYGASLLILSADGLTSKRIINNNRFAMDLLIGNCNLCVVFIWTTTIAIFQPRRPSETNNRVDDVEMRTNNNNHRKPFAQRIDMFMTRSPNPVVSTTVIGQAQSTNIVSQTLPSPPRDHIPDHVVLLRP
ncbi:hypothetical protein DFQ28_001689 [Apophysomyces sp. BC1034]|nr:hypothetical protein DFQ28_001689 [Apophysomyces sp. BC1034]